MASLGLVRALALTAMTAGLADVGASAQSQTGEPPRILGMIDARALPAGVDPDLNAEPQPETVTIASDRSANYGLLWPHPVTNQRPRAKAEESRPAKRPVAAARRAEQTAVAPPAMAGAEDMRLARAYEKGEGVAKDEAAAVCHYQAAAGQNNAEAQFALGYRSAHGLGLPRNDVEAVRWYRLAAASNHPPAQNNLAMMYAVGRGVARDDATAMYLFRTAAAGGYGPALTNLALVYETGRGAPRNDSEALTAYARAAASGYVPAKKKLGLMYASGRGVPQDDQMAQFWLQSAQGSNASGKTGQGVSP